jgi:hypothetical protein
MSKSNNKKKYLFIALVFYGFTFFINSLLINDLYANTNKNSHLIEEDHLDDEEDVASDHGQPCPKIRKVSSAPKEFINKTSPLRNEPRNLKKGKVLFRLKARKACKFCHGMEGKGNGSMADLAHKPPRNLTCKKYMNEITDGELFWVIKEGIDEAGMPSYNHLSDKKIWQLIQYIRTFSS